MIKRLKNQIASFILHTKGNNYLTREIILTDVIITIAI